MRKDVRLLSTALTIFVLYEAGGIWNWNSNLQSEWRVPRKMWNWKVHAPSPSSSVSPEERFSTSELVALDGLLNKAAFKNNTVIITTLNQAWAAQGGMLDMFLRSFQRGVNIDEFLEHLIIVALDQPSQDRCEVVHRHCFPLRTHGVNFSAEKVYMSEDYLKMMWRRIYFLGEVLQLGYNFVFTDADVLWFRNPFKHFNPRADFEIACDHFPDNHADTPVVNGGFLHVVSSNRTIDLYRFWYGARVLHPTMHDQDVLNILLLQDDIWRFQVKMRVLKTEVFGSFCQLRKRRDQMCTMHANCCIGLARKMSDLRLVEEDWRRYNTESSEVRQHFRWQAPVECPHSFDDWK